MNYKKIPVNIAVVCCLFFVSFLAMQAHAAQNQKRKPVVIPGKTFLPLKVLARPFSNIYKEADEKSPIVEENVPAFQTFFVYTKPKSSVTSTEARGWYEVGSDNRGTVLGWMKASDVMEWKQAMCLAYEHPLGRKPVLMFKELKPLRDLVKLPAEERIKKAEEYYKIIESKKIPADFPIVSEEPEGAIDITKHFYLLPILESSEIEIDGREGRLIKLASAPKAGRGKTTLAAGAASQPTPKTETAGEKPVKTENADLDLQKKTGESGSANASEQAASAGSNATVSAGNNMQVSDLEDSIDINDKEIRKKLAIDIVYVVDMTNSMQPYIDATVKALNSMVQKVISDPSLADKVRFGLWGYRDSTDIPGMEFVTRNFTPQLQDAAQFVQTMGSVKVAKAGSAGYDEDVFSGLDDAMQDTAWRENSLRFIILVGDAPGHQPGHKWNLSGQSAETLRTFANDNKIYLAAVHIVNPKASQFNEVAKQQFTTLALNRGSKEPTYFAIPDNNLPAVEETATTLAGTLIDQINDVIHKGVVAKTQAGSGNKQVAFNMGYAALVEWLGSQQGVEAPRDIIAWVTDKDLIDPSVSSLDVRVLINKKNLDSLKKTLTDIMAAGRRGMISGENFFDALLAVASAGGRDPDQIKNAKSLAATGLLPEFMTGLPYKSQIMEMNNEIWSAMSVDQQEEFLNALDAKLQLYVVIHDAPEGWVALTEGADPDEYVYPLSLTALP